MGVDPDLAKVLPPEVFMHCLSSGRVPLSEWLARTLSGSPPNAVHAVLAQAILNGDTVWSLNADELIESAFDELPGASARQLEDLTTHRSADGSPDPAARLLKPHGTVKLRNFIFETTQVIRPMPGDWATRLVADFSAADEIVFIGYRGADIDLRDALDTALRVSAHVSVQWHACSDEDWKEAQDYLPALAEVHRDAKRVCPNPSKMFVEWAQAEGIAPALTHDQEAGLDMIDSALPDPPRGRPRLARGYLLELLNQVQLAEDVFVAEFVRLRNVKTALFRFLKLRWYAGDRRFEPIMALDRTRAARFLFGPARKRVRRAHIMYESSVLGDHEAALELASRSDPRDPATWIVVAKAERYRGQCREALAAAQKASELAAPLAPTRPARADEKAHAVFEEIYSLIWLGRFAEAQECLGRLYRGYDAQARVRWMGWARYQQAGLALLLGEPERAIDELNSAERYFSADDDSGRRRAECLVLAAAAHRQAGNLRPAFTLRPIVGTDPVADLHNKTVAFERAEAYRSQGEFNQALEDYDEALVSRERPMLRCVVLLGRAECLLAVANGQGGAARNGDAFIAQAEQLVEQALGLAQRCELRHVVGHVLVTAERVRPSADPAGRLAPYREVLGAVLSDWAAPIEDLISGDHPIYCLW
jgi:tetratricopeptide (TPR) repeat protein